MYGLNEVGPLADLYVWSYRRSCAQYDTQVTVVGFNEISALYRPLRRAVVADLVRQAARYAPHSGRSSARTSDVAG